MLTHRRKDAWIAAVLVMLRFGGAVSRCVERNPTVKILALSFLSPIGTALVAAMMSRTVPFTSIIRVAPLGNS